MKKIIFLFCFNISFAQPIKFNLSKQILYPVSVMSLYNSHKTRVFADGGTIPDTILLKNFLYDIYLNRTDSFANLLNGVYPKIFGYKGITTISKAYSLISGRDFIQATVTQQPLLRPDYSLLFDGSTGINMDQLVSTFSPSVSTNSTTHYSTQKVLAFPASQHDMYLGSDKRIIRWSTKLLRFYADDLPVDVPNYITALPPSGEVIYNKNIYTSVANSTSSLVWYNSLPGIYKVIGNAGTALNMSNYIIAGSPYTAATNMIFYNLLLFSVVDDTIQNKKMHNILRKYEYAGYVNLICGGDSHTDGSSSTIPWPRIVRDSLNDPYNSQYWLTAKAAYTAEILDTKITDWVNTVYQSNMNNIFTLMIGSNDVYLYADPLWYNNWKTHTTSIINKVKAIGITKIIVSTIVPSAKSGYDSTIIWANTQKVNNWIRNDSAHLGFYINDLQNYSPFKYSYSYKNILYYNADQMHLTDRGYDSIAKSFKESIRRYNLQ